ncbi:ketopantoate reductase family protein [Azospirillum soli]|uniref:ketopantoate reductase family protein n=1 Tax=Azospirillum soli TaxID=1304799 RepID=UPI001AEA1FAE|nr:2-dehydropantoate 2-reductase [Azospirillum soli]MBP2316637.1 2-dehydropantoate 2-reductase [Azospirillum soli]
MKVAVIGAGAVGGLITARLNAAGLPVPLVARRRTLDTLRREGLTVEGPSAGPITVRPPVTDDTLSLGPQDAVVLAVPAFALPEVLELLPPLLGRNTRLVPVVGGIPWWYPAGEHPLVSVDPQGLLWNAIPAERIVGAVPRIAVERRTPGYVRHLGGLRLALGPAVGPTAGQDGAGDLATLFGAAGFNAPVADNIRAEVWSALLAPLAFGALGLVTGLPAQDIVRHPDLQPVLAAVVEELSGLAARLGHPVTVDLDDAWALAQHPGRVRPDLTAAGRTEIEAVLDAPLELAERAGVALPTVGTLRALVRQKRQQAQRQQTRMNRDRDHV